MPQTTLPEGLLVYAENIFRRFPEEFIALGCPNLEREFELRSASRRFSEAGGTKTIEISLHRARPDSPTFPMSPVSQAEMARTQAPTDEERNLATLISSVSERCAALERSSPERAGRASGSLQRPPALKVEPVIAPAHPPAQPTQARSTPARAPEAKRSSAEARTWNDGRNGTASPQSPMRANRPAPVHSQRIAKEEDEPESPRSPGWFSAWGKSK